MQGLVTQFLSQGHCPCCSARCSRGRAGLLPGTTPRGAGAGALGGGVVTTPLQGADWLASRLKEFPPKHNRLHVSEREGGQTRGAQLTSQNAKGRDRWALSV